MAVDTLEHQVMDETRRIPRIHPRLLGGITRRIVYSKHPEMPAVALQTAPEPFYLRENSKFLRNESINLSQQRPLLSRTEVNEQLGFDLGTLQAAISLPIPLPFVPELVPPPIRLYCFKRDLEVGRHRVEGNTRYIIVSQAGLDYLKTSANTGLRFDDELASEMFVMGSDRNTHFEVGREAWLPGVGDVNGAHTPVRYGNIGRRQLAFEIEANGDLQLRDLGSTNPTQYNVGPEPVQAFDHPTGGHPIVQQ